MRWTILREQENMLLKIREGIAEMLHELKELHKDTKCTESWAKSSEHKLGKTLGREVKLARHQTVVRSSPDLQKRKNQG